MTPRTDPTAPRRRSHRTALALVAGLVGGALLAGGIAVAAIPSTATGRFTACVSKATGATRIIDVQARGRCTSAERTVSWSSGWTSRGAWSARASYAVNDVVRRGGAGTYVAIRPHRGVDPAGARGTTSWRLVAADGAAGPQGAVGPQGPVGPVGPQGPQGPVGPSEVYERNVDLYQWPAGNSGPLVVASVSVPDPTAAYLVQAAASVENTSTGATAVDMNCLLRSVTPQVQGPIGQSLVSLPDGNNGTALPGALGTVSLVGVRPATPSSTALAFELRCTTTTTPGGIVRLTSAKVVAQKVGAVTRQTA